MRGALQERKIAAAEEFDKRKRNTRSQITALAFFSEFE
jgi:hypothetical protein